MLFSTSKSINYNKNKYYGYYKEKIEDKKNIWNM